MGVEFVRDFMSIRQWDEESVSSFLFRWDELTLSQHEELRESEQFRLFVEDLRSRIQVDRAIGAPVFRNGLSLIESLSVELELDLVEPSAIEQEVVAVAPEPVEITGEPFEPPSVVEAPLETALSSEPEAPATIHLEIADEPVQPDPAIASPGETQIVVPFDVAPKLVVSEEIEEVRFPSEQACTADRLNFRSAACWDMIDADLRGPIMRVIPAGEFVMGEDADDSAAPAHKQRIAQPFAIGKSEVSVSDYWNFCEDEGTQCPRKRWASDEHPIVDVSWQDASRYVLWLSRKTGATYRLPTEAEWEFAARAGTTTKYPFGNTLSATYARYDSGMRKIGPLPVDDLTTRPNKFDLFHVAGNVREWTEDTWRANYSAETQSGARALRGGSYADQPDRLRSAARESAEETYSDARTGFRVARDL